GPARLVVLREPDSGRIQPLLKNKSPEDQFIFQRRTPILTKASRHAEAPSLDAELALIDSEMESDKVASKIDTRNQDEGQAGPNHGDHDEGQAGPNPVVYDEGHAGSNSGDAAESQPQSSHFFMKKQQEEEQGKTNAEAEVQSMVLVPIYQDTSSVPLMTTPVSKAVDGIVTDAIDWAMQAPLRAHFSDLPTKLYDALEKSLECDYSDQLLSDLDEARQKKRTRRYLPRTPYGSPPPQPPPLPPPAGTSGALGTSGASRSS
nr:hypothetical protein [Tanacetum cinerariifolium]